MRTPNQPLQLCLFFEENHPRIFEADPNAVEHAEYQINRLYEVKGYATLNDVYFLLGLPLLDACDEIGWHDFDGMGPAHIGFIYSVESISKDISPRDVGVEMYVMKISFNPKPFMFEQSIHQYRREYYGRKE